MASSDVLTTNLRIEDIELGVFTPRLSFSEDYVAELAELIKHRGQDKPIICRPHPSVPDKYQCIDGEHRIRAMKRLGIRLIRSELRMLTDTEARILALAVNRLHGKRLDKMEQDLHIQKLHDEDGLSFREIASKLDMDVDSVHDAYKRATKASPKVKEALARANIKPKAAAKLAELEPEDQDLIVEEAPNLTLRKTEAIVSSFKVAETPEEKTLIVEKLADPEISSKTAKAVANALKSAETHEKRMDILKSPLEALEEVLSEPEVLEGAVTAPPEEAVIEAFTCPSCGTKILVDWVEHKVEWQ